MKKKLAMLFVVIMILSCMPVMAGTVPAGADAATATQTVSATAAFKPKWVKAGSNLRFYYEQGKYFKNGVFKIGKEHYGFNSKGYLQKGFYKIGKKTYFGSNAFGPKGYGIVVKGYVQLGTDYYYLQPKLKGAAAGGFVKIGKKLYYFDPATYKQRRKKGWFTVGKNQYYVQADGTIAVSTTIDGVKVNAKGAATDPYGMDKKAQGYSSNTNYEILVNKKAHIVNVYKGSKGKWVPVRSNIPCTIGKSSTPSRSGVFKISTMRKNRKHGWKDFASSTAFYAARIDAGFYFHSILYKLGSRDPATAKVKDGRLGKNISNSCIRLPLADAKYVYELPLTTRVVIYD